MNLEVESTGASPSLAALPCTTVSHSSRKSVRGVPLGPDVHLAIRYPIAMTGLRALRKKIYKYSMPPLPKPPTTRVSRLLYCPSRKEPPKRQPLFQRSCRTQGLGGLAFRVFGKEPWTLNPETLNKGFVVRSVTLNPKP